MVENLTQRVAHRQRRHMSDIYKFGEDVVAEQEGGIELKLEGYYLGHDENGVPGSAAKFARHDFWLGFLRGLLSMADFGVHRIPRKKVNYLNKKNKVNYLICTE